MHFARIFAAAALALAPLGAGHAAVITISDSGVITEAGAFEQGSFATGTAVVGQTYSISFGIDPDAAVPESGSTADFAAFRFTPTAFSATFGAASLAVAPPSIVALTRYEVSPGLNAINVFVSFAGPATATVPYNSIVTPAVETQLDFVFSVADATGPVGLDALSRYGTAFGRSASVAVLGASGGNNTTPIGGLVGAPVPEPGSWALMMLGFGLTGAALRRQRNETPLAA